MAWNEVVSQVRDKIRRKLGGNDGERVFVTSNPVEPLSGASLATPAVDVYENEREFLVIADVPGATRDGATVACDGPRRLTRLVKGAPAPDVSQKISMTPRMNPQSPTRLAMNAFFAAGAASLLST